MGTEGKSGYGPKLKRLVEAKVVTEEGARELGQQVRNAIEGLDPGQVQTLIDVADHAGRRPNCWLI